MLNMPDRLAALERRIATLEANPATSLRFGSVTGVEGGFARVQLPDGQNMVSALIPTVQKRVLKDKDIKMPDIGEPVACLFSGQGMETGIVVGACYSPVTPDPSQPRHMDYTKYADGTELWYDRKAHKLIAKVKGDAEIESTGAIRLEAVKEITIKAPQIHMLGNLDQRGHDGGRGFNAFKGTLQVNEGSVHVPDESITVGQSIAVGADVLAQGISLVRHLHGGVMQGNGNSDIPSGSNGNGIENSFTDDQKREQIFDTLTSPHDKLILCMPDIAEHESSIAQKKHDKDGWQLLHDLMEKWLHHKSYVVKPDNKEKREYDVCELPPTYVSWDWLLKYKRVHDVCDELSASHYLFSKEAKNTLHNILINEKAFTHEYYEFDHHLLDWKQWRSKAFQGYGHKEYYYDFNPTEGKPDGLVASIGSFTIFALSSGHTRRLADGSFNITIKNVFFFLFDCFDFSGDQLLGSWDCTKHEFVALGQGLNNWNFRMFRERTGYGSDFRVISPLKRLETFTGEEYNVHQL